MYYSSTAGQQMLYFIVLSLACNTFFWDVCWALVYTAGCDSRSSVDEDVSRSKLSAFQHVVACNTVPPRVRLRQHLTRILQGSTM